MDDRILKIRINYLTEEECNNMVKAIMDILHDNKIQTYEVRFGTSVDAGFDE